ncbi:hypothetical protein [Streptomyces subrutilus]|nr:hypothetical protein OG479_34415 [Streptomyces subrutilus]
MDQAYRPTPTGPRILVGAHQLRSQLRIAEPVACRKDQQGPPHTAVR